MVEATIRVEPEEAWLATFGNDGQGFAHWVGALRSLDGSPFEAWDDTSGLVSDWIPNPQDFSVYDDEENNWYDVSVEQLVQGYVSVKFSYPHLFVEPDSVTEDFIMQFAVFGELVYG